VANTNKWKLFSVFTIRVKTALAVFIKGGVLKIPASSPQKATIKRGNEQVEVLNEQMERLGRCIAMCNLKKAG
jgi:hypothetical protein